MTLKNKQTIIMVAFLASINSLATDPNDLLSGTALFATASLGSFTSDSAHTTSFLNVNSTNVLKLQKASSQAVSFSSGLEYSFTSSQPVHVSFQFSTITTDTQDANLRLIDSSSDQTVLLFRAGKAGFIRVNQNQMVSFYNSTVCDDSNVTTIKMDITLDWKSKTANIYVDESYRGSARFFQQVTSVDKLRLYNLYQSTSYWKNLVVCSPQCYSFSNGKSLLFSVSIFSILAVFIFLN